MPTVALDVPSAHVLADQASIIQDLQFVMDCCKRLLTELAKPEEDRDPLMPVALWSSAVLAYGRCFGKGKRFGLVTEDVRNLPLHGAVMKFHKWVLEERDKLAAHAPNPDEAAKVGAALSPPEQKDRRVEGIVIFASSHVLIDDVGVRQLGGLASELAKQTAEKAQEQQDIVLKDAQQLNLDSLYQLPKLGTWPPDDSPPDDRPPDRGRRPGRRRRGGLLFAPDGPDAAQDLVGTERGGHLLQVGAARRPGQQHPDDLGGLPDGALVGGRILLVGLLAGREPQGGRQQADLVEPIGPPPRGPGRPRRSPGPRPALGPGQVRCETGVRGVGDQLEDLREEDP